MESSKQAWQTIAKPSEGESTSFDLTVQMETRVDGAMKRLQMQEGGFVICMHGKFYAYRNHCPHIGSPLDWVPNQFFSDNGQTLLCHTHGATFEPTTGNCLTGPCPRGLYPLDIKLFDQSIAVPKLIQQATSAKASRSSSLTPD